MDLKVAVIQLPEVFVSVLLSFNTDKANMLFFFYFYFYLALLPLLLFLLSFQVLLQNKDKV